MGVGWYGFDGSTEYGAHWKKTFYPPVSVVPPNGLISRREIYYKWCESWTKLDSFKITQDMINPVTINNILYLFTYLFWGLTSLKYVTFKE